MDLILAKSKNGHDKNKIYFVFKSEDGVCSLVNGNNKTIKSPKIKKKIHLQIIKKLPIDFVNQFDLSKIDDELIKNILSSYSRRNKNV